MKSFNTVLNIIIKVEKEAYAWNHDDDDEPMFVNEEEKPPNIGAMFRKSSVNSEVKLGFY